MASYNKMLPELNKLVICKDWEWSMVNGDLEFEVLIPV